MIIVNYYYMSILFCPYTKNTPSHIHKSRDMLESGNNNSDFYGTQVYHLNTIIDVHVFLLKIYITKV